MKQLFSCFLLIWICSPMQAQENDTIQNKENRLELNLDLASRYLWRGQCWGGDYAVVQPTINYDLTDKLTLGFWATTNFKKDYFYPDGTPGKGYQEIDFNLSYEVNSWLTFQIWDYYWPSVEKVEGVNNGYFNYGKDGTKTIDANLLMDFTDYELPLCLTLSTLVAGNDFRYNDEGENAKQNYTTYFEALYTFEKLIGKISFETTAGAVLNNQAEYYTSGDYDKPSLVNLSVKAIREIELGKRLTMPLSLNYIHNAATKNTEFFGKNFLVAGITFNYQ